MFDSRFQLKEQEGGKMLNKRELYRFYSSPATQDTYIWKGNQKHTNIWLEKLKGIGHLGYAGVGGGI
jgi:hypothetical protein